MTLQQIVIWLLVGLAAGWLASVVVGSGLGVIGDIVVGIVGAFLGGWIFSAMHWRVPIAGLGGTILVAFLGACVLLVLLRLIRSGPRRGWR
jgi:uncharacterized membrane protein YeaQ/YmgE (transglycosylase-associated protein family)